LQAPYSQEKGFAHARAKLSECFVKASPHLRFSYEDCGFELTECGLALAFLPARGATWGPWSLRVVTRLPIFSLAACIFVAKASNCWNPRRVPLEGRPAVCTVATLVVDATGAVAARCLGSTAKCAAGSWGKWLRCWATLLDCDVATGLPDLWRLLRLPAKAHDIVSFWQVSWNLDLIHDAEVEVLFLELLIGAVNSFALA